MGPCLVGRKEVAGGVKVWRRPSLCLFPRRQPQVLHDSDPHAQGGGELPSRAVERSRGRSAWTPFITKARQMGIEADSEGRWRRQLSGDKGPPFLVGTHIRLKPEPGNLPPRKTLLVLPTDGKWVRAVRNEPNGLLALAKASNLVLSQMRTVVGVGRGRRQLGRVFSLGRNSLPLLGLGNVRISHVSKNKAKGSVYSLTLGWGEGRNSLTKGYFMSCLCCIHLSRTVTLRMA